MDFTPHAGTPARPRPRRFLEEGRLEACGYALAIIYAVIFVHLYRAGSWIIDIAGAPVYTDFATIWVAGIEAVRGEAARLYDSAQFLKIQAQLLGTRPFFYPNWPYPPILPLIAARQWRAIASAAVTVVALAVLSAAAFGIGAWEMLPTGLLAQKDVVLLAGGAADADANWGHIQTIYGLVRELHGGGVFAILLHCAGALAVAVIVWRVWRSSASYDLKAAAVSAAALIATPYAFSYDMAALAIPVAFVARDQLRDGLLRREQATLLALFGIVLTAFGAFWVNQDNFDFGRMPLGLIALVTVMFLIMRRAAIPVFFQKRQWT